MRPPSATPSPWAHGSRWSGTLLLGGYDVTPLILPAQPMVLNRLHVMASPLGSPHDLRDTPAFSARRGTESCRG